MRIGLKSIQGQRMRFTAQVERFGTKTGFKLDLPTILLKNVIRVDTLEVVTDHLWFTKGKSWANCTIGCTVAFDARVNTYEKGYKGYREDVYAPISLDYKLERPTKVEII
jgi:hypothetical protein